MLSEICVRRPVFATMLVTSLVVLGGFSFRDLGVDLFPQADPATVNVTLRLPGAAPDEVTSAVVMPMENALSGVAGIEQLSSTVSAGGVATPADAALMMQLGAESVFVGSGIFKSSDPAVRAKAIVQATTHFKDPDVLAKVSEGLGDFVAATISGDPAMAPGFFNNADPMRHCDPAGSEFVWPEDRGEIHDTGRIYCGAMFDLRKNMIALYGDAGGRSRTDKLGVIAGGGSPSPAGGGSATEGGRGGVQGSGRITALASGATALKTEPEQKLSPAEQLEVPLPFAKPDAKATAAVRRAEAKAKGYEGEMCGECLNFTLVRNGTCLKCDTCGSTTGCS